MKILGYCLIVLGALQFTFIGYDELRGATHAPYARGAYVSPGIIHKQSQPEDFRDAIACHCYYAIACLLLGIVAVIVDKRMDQSDPLSPDFAGNSELDDWAKSMKEEEDRQKIIKEERD